MPKSVESRLSEHDKQIAAIRKLLIQGGKILVRVEAAQLRTEKKLQALIDTLNRSRNGRNGGKK